MRNAPDTFDGGRLSSSPKGLRQAWQPTGT